MKQMLYPIVAILAAVTFIGLSGPSALAHHKKVIKKTTVTTTTTTIVREKHPRHDRSVTKKERRKVWHQEPHQRRSTKLGIRNERIEKPETRRHKHFVKNKHGKRIHVFPGTHRHGRFLPHTHDQENIIHISPKAKKWPTPKPHAAFIETPFVPQNAFKKTTSVQESYDVAVIVRETVNGVTIIRNVRTIRSKGLEIEDESTIGVTDLPRPSFFLTEEEIDECEPQIKTLGQKPTTPITIGNAQYCD